jgi:30S ribosomal protein S31
MGKGDKKTRRGKISMGTHGVNRPRKVKKIVPPVKEEKPKK